EVPEDRASRREPPVPPRERIPPLVPAVGRHPPLLHEEEKARVGAAEAVPGEPPRQAPPRPGEVRPQGPRDVGRPVEDPDPVVFLSIPLFRRVRIDDHLVPPDGDEPPEMAEDPGQVPDRLDQANPGVRRSRGRETAGSLPPSKVLVFIDRGSLSSSFRGARGPASGWPLRPDARGP